MPESAHSEAELLALLPDLDRLNRLLAGASHGSATLSKVSAASIGTGQVGENLRLTLTWSEPGGGLPTVVAKVPSLSETSRAAAAATMTYIREVGFYRDAASMVDIPIPRLLHVEEDRAANDFLLLMADVSPAVQGDQLGGCSRDQAQQAVRAAAMLHGPTWNHELLTGLDWIDQATSDRAAARSQFYGATIGGFLDRYASDLSAEDKKLAVWAGENLAAIDKARNAPICLGHGDYRLDNMLFGLDDSVAPLTVVDWQTANLMPAIADVAYFLGSAMEPDDRARCERDLVREYLAALETYEVSWDPDDAWVQYCLASYGGLAMAVIASQIVERTDRGDQMFLTMARRHAAQMRHLEITSLV